MVWKRLKPDVNEVLAAIEELVAKEDRYQLGKYRDRNLIIIY